MSLPPIFSPEYYAHWRTFEETSWWNAAMRDVASMLFEQGGLPSTGTLLDIGCGSGQGMRWFSEFKPQWRLVGIDPGVEGLRAARAAGFEEVTLGSATELPHPDNSVDAVILLDVLQHLPLDGGDEVALREMSRVLRPGGLLLIRTNAQSFPRQEPDREAQWQKYDPSDLRSKLLGAGFKIERLSRLNALLGLAEIPRDLRRGKDAGHTSYEVVHTTPTRGRAWSWSLKRSWLRLEGRAVCAGLRLPFGRSIVTLCRAT